VAPQHPDLQPADERTALEQFLDQQRAIVAENLADLDQAAAASRPLPATDLTVIGIVKHLAWTEDRWFQERLLGTASPQEWSGARFDDDRDWDFHSAVDDSVDEVLALYAAACERSRAAAAQFDALDVVAAVPSFGKGPVTLRWILVHMIEETARHAGHLDLLRDEIHANSRQ
jgi:uncharacterized damage-inducible protein DinB